MASPSKTTERATPKNGALEKSTWAAHHRVEQLARKELGMRLPEASELRVVMP